MITPGLVAFLYILGRDHLPTGEIRRIIEEHIVERPGLTRVYSDPHLEAWARARADEIIRDGRTQA